VTDNKKGVYTTPPFIKDRNKMMTELS